jgi:hypothetical protein
VPLVGWSSTAVDRMNCIAAWPETGGVFSPVCERAVLKLVIT